MINNQAPQVYNNGGGGTSYWSGTDTQSTSASSKSGFSITSNPQQQNSTDYSRMLSAKERKELEIPMSLYVNIKLLNSIENLYQRDYITKEQEMIKADPLVEKILKSEQILASSRPGFTIDGFMAENDLKDCLYVKSKLDQNKNPDEKRKKMPILIASITSNFIKISDLYVMNSEQYPVKDIMPAVQQMALEMNELRACFKREFPLAQRYQALVTKYNKRDISDTFSKEESKEIMDTNSYATNEFHNFLRLEQ
jgi:hypothetical protein